MDRYKTLNPIKFYCSGCGGELEDLSKDNRVIQNLRRSLLTGKFYHGILCEFLDSGLDNMKFFSSKSEKVCYKDLEKLVKK